MPRSAARARVEGRAAPARRRPCRMASRSQRCSSRPSRPRGAPDRSMSSSRELVCSECRSPVLSTGPLSQYGSAYASNRSRRAAVGGPCHHRRRRRRRRLLTAHLLPGADRAGRSLRLGRGDPRRGRAAGRGTRGARRHAAGLAVHPAGGRCGHVAVQRRRPVPLVVAGACMVAAGAAVVEGFGRADAAALAWSVVALACEVAFTIAAAPVLRTISPLALSLRACTLAAVLLALASLAVVATSIAFLLWYRAVRRLGAETTGLLAGAMPVAAAVAAAVVTPAPLRWQTLAGTFLVAAGLAFALTRSHPVAAESVSSSSGGRR